MPGNNHNVGSSRYRRIKKKSLAASPALSINMALFNANDKSSFINLYNHLFPFIFYFAKRFTGSEDAEDITADAFYKLWKMEKKFRDIRGVKTFLQVAARNACINHLEHAKVVNKAAKELLNMGNVNQDAFDYTSEVNTEKIKIILAEIENMPLQRKKIFKLSYFGGLKDKEIATGLNISLSSVYNHKSIALKQLRLSSHHLFFFLSLPFSFLLFN